MEFQQFSPSSYIKLASHAESAIGELQAQIKEQNDRFDDVRTVLEEVAVDGSSVKLAVSTMGVMTAEMEAIALLAKLKAAWNRKDQVNYIFV